MRKFFLPLLLLLAAAPAGAQAPGYRARLDSFFTLLDRHGKSMCGAALRRAGVPVYSRSIGYTKLPVATGPDSGRVAGAPPVEGTAYHIGSESKVFTAVMILQLIDEQKLQRETRLSAFFPALPEAPNMTVDQLLHHRSGLSDFTSAPGLGSWMAKPQSREKMLERIAGAPRDFKPGEKFDYCNTNYLLLSYIIEQVDGTDYASALAKRITGPLGLRHTGLYRAKADVAGYTRVNSYEREGGSWTYVKQTDPSVALGAGAVEASPADMCIFIEALLTGRLTSDSLLRYMRDLGPDNYGAGLFSKTYSSNRKGLGHTGRIDGFHSIVLYFPDDSLSIAISINGLDYPMKDLLSGMLDIYYGAPEYRLPVFGAARPLPGPLDGEGAAHSAYLCSDSRRNRPNPCPTSSDCSPTTLPTRLPPARSFSGPPPR